MVIVRHDMSSARAARYWGKNDIAIVFIPAIYIMILKYTGKDDLALFRQNYCRDLGRGMHRNSVISDRLL